MDCIIEIIDQGDPVDIFYFDFKKAFDRVPHNRLLYKLECLGIKGKVLDIIRDFLTGRSFCVCVGGEFSNLKDVLSGIPQGSVLGPLLFVLYINDLPNNIKSFAKLFADDLKMIAKASDKLQVDNDLKMLELWESTWELSDAVLSRIEGANYADNKSSHNELLKKNPYVAKIKFINMH